MKKNSRILLAGLLLTAMVLAPVAGIAQDKPKVPPGSVAPEKPSASARPLPFRGTVAAVDKAAKTVKVGERVFHISAETQLTKSGKPATIGDVAVGDPITGSYTKGDDGKLTAKTLRFGPKSESAEKPAKKEKSAENSRE